MRKAVKDPQSKVLTKNMKYVKGNSANNLKIAEELLIEQKGFCAYTDECITRSDARDIEHFNPTLKYTEDDGYNNWFVVKHQWNKEKSSKWAKHQPVLHPAAVGFDERIIYLDGDYVAGSAGDIEAINLVALLKLDDPALADKRKKYLRRKHSDLKDSGYDALTFFKILLEAEPCGVSYTRALKEEFGVNVWDMIK